MSLIVFMDNQKVMQYLEFPISYGDFGYIREGFNRNEAIFAVSNKLSGGIRLLPL
jgi:hypothetical protein